MKKFGLLILLFLLILLSVLITACGSEEIQYTFPLARGNVEEVLLQEDVSWHIEESQSFQEGHSLYTFKNENDKFIANVSTYSKDGLRHLGLNFFTPSKIAINSIMEQVNESEWENMFKIACTLYGNSKDYKKVYKEFVKYCNNRKSSEYGRTQWHKRVGDAHFRVTLNPLEEGSEEFILRGIDIMNSVAFEDYSSNLVNMWKDAMDRESVEILENITVADINEMNEEDNDLVKAIVIKGRLKNIRKLNNNELPSTIFPNSKVLPYKEDYLGAKLVDDTGTIQVIIVARSLNKAELGQVRNHYAYYFGNDNACVIALSVLDEK